MVQHSEYYKRLQVVIDHTTGTVRSKTIVLGGHVEVAESSGSKDHEGRMEELFKHQQPAQLSAASERFLGRGRESNVT